MRRKISANSIAGGDQSSTSQMGSTAKANLVDGREEIYGWSVNASLLNNANLPNRSNTLAIDRTSRRPTTTRRATTMIPEHSAVDSSFDKDDLANQKELSKTLPIPAYSRPLMEKDPSFKVSQSFLTCQGTAFFYNLHFSAFFCIFQEKFYNKLMLIFKF